MKKNKTNRNVIKKTDKIKENDLKNSNQYYYNPRCIIPLEMDEHMKEIDKCMKEQEFELFKKYL